MKNIKAIELWEVANGKPNPVKVTFEFPCTWTIFEVSDLLKILELWIIGEEMVYPQSRGFKGRWMLFDEIKKVFDTVEVQ